MGFSEVGVAFLAVLGIAMMLMSVWAIVLRLATKRDGETFAKAAGLFFGGAALLIPFAGLIYFALSWFDGADGPRPNPPRIAGPSAVGTPAASAPRPTPR